MLIDPKKRKREVLLHGSWPLYLLTQSSVWCDQTGYLYEKATSPVLECVLTFFQDM